MKKWMSILLAGVMLVGLCGCNNTPDVSDDDSSITTTTITTTATTTTTKTNAATPMVATGEYNGQTVTMSYIVTKVNYPGDMRSIEMRQGYAVFYDYTAIASNGGDRWNLLDRNGNRVLSEPYMELESFNQQGIAVAQKENGAYVQLNTKLEEKIITEQEYTSFCLDSANYPCNREYPQGEGDYSCLNDGLAVYVEYKGTTAYAGLADENGNVIIEAFIPIYYNAMIERLHLSENVAFVEDITTNNIAMIIITRS